MNSSITLAFNTAMDQAAVEASLAITPDVYGTLRWEGNSLIFTPTIGLAPATTYTVSLGIGARTVQAGALAPGTTYAVSLSSGASAAHVGALALPYVWYFATAAVVIPADPIAFVRAVDAGTANIWLMSPNGSVQVPITWMPPNETAAYPAWAPGGGKLAFSTTAGQIFTLLDENLVVTNPDGSGAYMVTGAGIPGQKPGPVGSVVVQVLGPGKVTCGELKAEPFPSTFLISAQATGHAAPAGASTAKATSWPAILAGVPEGPVWVKVWGVYKHGGVAQAADTTVVVRDQVTKVSLKLSFRRDRALWPTWSPDGTRLLYNQTLTTPECTGIPETGEVSTGWGSSDKASINVVNADGSGSALVYAHDLANVWRPDWSPDGARIVFAVPYAVSEAGYWGIYTMNPNGTGVRQLTSSTVDAFTGTVTIYDSPSYSPDGSKIAYAMATTNFLTGLSDIYVMNADGTEKRKLTSMPLGQYPEKPSWSPDGTRIAFSVKTGGVFPAPTDKRDVYVINADGTGQTRLTHDGMSGFPAWRR